VGEGYGQGRGAWVCSDVYTHMYIYKYMYVYYRRDVKVNMCAYAIGRLLQRVKDMVKEVVHTLFHV